jgi:hypothetical protein
VPAVDALQLGDPVTLDGSGQDDGRFLRCACRGECVVDRDEVVSVDEVGGASEGPKPGLIPVQVPLQFGGAAHSEAVDVDDRGEVVQTVIGGASECLPHRTFCELAVAAQNPDVVVDVIQVEAGQGDADRVG